MVGDKQEITCISCKKSSIPFMMDGIYPRFTVSVSDTISVRIVGRKAYYPNL